MKTFLTIAALAFILAAISPTYAQVRWGVDVHLGSPVPPPREVIVEQPYPDAVWEPGYYRYEGYRHFWTPGYWHRPHYWVPLGHRFDRDEWREGRGEHRGWDRDRDGDRHESHDRGGRGNDYRQGRIR
ncbi:MAG: hypothetical protein Q8916_08900 [Bacteroidota bacterium]|nr:hypothetical protein [Bacteroidota bacterium]MDP4230504.1 hypothetical protein [Bacteroidota bacterium]MDP4237384.1 hypothetical protein [Bacteroidota bacterium]